MLFNINRLKNTDQVRNEVNKLVAKQKKGSADDLRPFSSEIARLLKHIDFKPDWRNLPVVGRVALIDTGQELFPFIDDIILPNTKHDLELVIKMLNHMREQKNLPQVKMPLFVQPDEVSLAHKEGRFSHDGGNITSQVSLVIQKGAIMQAGFVFGRDYVILHA